MRVQPEARQTPSASELVRLRDSVEEWTKRATASLEGFGKDDGSFWKDTNAAKETQKDPNVTTTARAFFALMSADRASRDRRPPAAPWWVEKLKTFVATPRIAANGEFVQIRAAKGDGTEDGHAPKAKTNDVNAFDIAHLTDFIVAGGYANRFHAGGEAVAAGGMVRVQGDGAAGTVIAARLKRAVRESLSAGPNRGQVHFEEGEDTSRHFFATLHVLRALHALEAEFDGDLKQTDIDDVADAARSFAIEQCYYFQRGTTHKQDPVRLAFAGCIYAIYDVHIDKDLCLAIVESLAASQQENGSWPATHPVLRKGQQPWHIASHEVALCLTWLYFQPRVPDVARPVLISMLEQHFRKAVIPTFVTTASAGKNKPMRGWQDDHTVSPDAAVGWATAIVTHYLANFSFVLDDWINRLVVEELGIEAAAKDYLIDDTMAAQSLKWRHGKDAATILKQRAIWPDLPPHAWPETRPSNEALASLISGNWTDPSAGAAISKKTAGLVLGPIFDHPGQRPLAERCAALLPGAPGTRKTSFVGIVATSVQWPMISPPASLIFAKGFELMESQANEVFTRLSYLRGCVVFFDEFEEFFLTRDTPEDGGAAAVGDQAYAEPSTGSYQSRTIAAFTTSAMLPRLQDLHDRDACLIFLATNYPDKIDKAIKRAGRFDMMIEIDHPGRKRLIEYLDALPVKAMERCGLKPVEKAGRLPEVLAAAKGALTSYGDAEAETVGREKAEALKFKHLEDVLKTLSTVPSSGLKTRALERLLDVTRIGDAKGNPPDILAME